MSSPASSARGCDCLLRRLLGPGPAAFPAIDSGESNAEPLGELILREVKPGANSPQRSWDVLKIC